MLHLLVQLVTNPEQFEQRFELMARAARRGVELGPYCWAACNALPWARLDENDWIGAKEAFQQSVNLVRSSGSRIEFQCATYVETLGRMDETIERLKTLRVLDPLNLETSIFLIWHDALSGTRQTPEFKEFPVAFGVVELFRATGEWNDYCQPVGADDFECV